MGHGLAYFVKLNREAVVIGTTDEFVLSVEGHLFVGAELFVVAADFLAKGSEE